MTITDEKLREAWYKCRKDRIPVYGDDAKETIAADDTIEAALAELETLRAASVWQPIETAPRDGSLIVVYRPLAHLSQDPTLTLKRTTAEPSHCFEQTIPFGYNKNQHFNDGAAFATHWMPLPTPPKEASND